MDKGIVPLDSGFGEGLSGWRLSRTHNEDKVRYRGRQFQVE
jgi:hypothetical protein